MFTLLISLLVGAVLAMGMNVVALLPATLCVATGILSFDLLQSGLSFSTLQSCLIAAVSLQIGYAAGICARYLLKTPPRARVTARRLAESKKSYVEVA